MYKKHIIWFSLLAVLLTSILIVAGCSKKVAEPVKPDANLVITPKLTSPADAAAIVGFTLTVLGDDMEPQVFELQFDGRYVYGEVEVEVGGRRTFILEAYNEFGEVVYRGVTVADVLPDIVLTLEIAMEPVVPIIRLTPRQTTIVSGQTFELNVEVNNIVGLGGVSVVLTPDSNFRWLQVLDAYPNPALGDNIYFNLTPIGIEGVTAYQVFVATADSSVLVDQLGNGTLATVVLSSTAYLDDVTNEAYGDTVTAGMTITSFDVYGADLDTLPEVDVRVDKAQVRLDGQAGGDRVVVFPDSVLDDIVRRWAGITSGPIMLSDVLPWSYLNIGDQGVADISGMENLLNLTYFDMRWSGYARNNPWDLSPLSGLVKLQTLLSDENWLDDLSPLSTLTNMVHLQIEGEAEGPLGVTNLSPIQTMTRLEHLDFDWQTVADISVLLHLPQLTHLEMSYNDVGNLSALQYVPELQTLLMNYNFVTDISALQHLQQLNLLEARGNDIANIAALEYLPSLHYVDLNYNNITNIQPLVDNLNFGENDTCRIWNNPLDSVSANHLVNDLRARGVWVDIPQ